MTTFGIVMLSVCGAGAALWFVLFFWTKLIYAKPKTIAEAAVRLLHALARLFLGLAEGLDSAIIVFRELQHEPLQPRAELQRQAEDTGGATFERLQRVL
jgi:hypothetical protein